MYSKDNSPFGILCFAYTIFFNKYIGIVKYGDFARCCTISIFKGYDIFLPFCPRSPQKIWNIKNFNQTAKIKIFRIGSGLFDIENSTLSYCSCEIVYTVGINRMGIRYSNYHCWCLLNLKLSVVKPLHAFLRGFRISQTRSPDHE